MTAAEKLDLAESPSPPWHQRAGCRAPGVNPDWFFPKGSRHARADQIRLARTVCWTACPVRRECEAASTTLDVGVRGGYWLGDNPSRLRCGAKAAAELAEVNRRTDPRSTP